VPLIFDAAPAFGASYAGGAMVGTKGIAEVFSLSPTKPFTSGEGGIVTTDDGDLAREVRTGREYGNPGNFDSLIIGLSGRLPELSAALGRNNLQRLPARLTRRRELAERYRRGLADVPGIGFQRVPAGASSTFKDFCVTIDPAPFGIDADAVAEAMGAERITTRRYYDPPVHRQSAYLNQKGPALPQARPETLPNTESVAAKALTVPLHMNMDERLVDQICEVLRRIHVHAGKIAEVRTASGTDTENRRYGFTR
jgi:dTDP-4-amino-4,6-dideoxygalactose transaminase